MVDIDGTNVATAQTKTDASLPARPQGLRDGGNELKHSRGTCLTFPYSQQHIGLPQARRPAEMCPELS